MAGLGADEILLGHDSYRTVRRLKPWISMLRPLPFGLRSWIAPSLLALKGVADAPLVAGRLARGEPMFLTSETFFDDAGKQAVSSPAWREFLGRWPASAALPEPPGAGDPSELALADLRLRMPELLLAGQDRMAMAHGVTVRSPFLDHQLVDYALAVPPGRRTGRDFERRVLSHALAGTVPDIIARRPAQQRAVPLDRWFRGGFGDLLEQRLQGGQLVADGIIDGAAGRAMLARHRAGTQPGQEGRLWTLLMLAEWYEAFSHATKLRSAAEPARLMDAAE
jgi:asparagine synthase (glutamine-hydrolysing)